MIIMGLFFNFVVKN